MKSVRSGIRSAFLAVVLLAQFTVVARAQQPTQHSADQPTGEGINIGDYNVKQSVEFGGRITSFTGNDQVYATYVNLASGPRLFGQTLEMRSLDNKGPLFDDLFTTSFGYGGDPNNVSILRVSKNKWYNFDATFRRDRNYWDYNLLANPLNPSNSVPFVPITLSPHLFQLSRDMTLLNLTMLPESRVRFRLGYLHNNSYGPSDSSVHEGTDALLFQGAKTTADTYRVGVDFRILPRTNFSYDQYYSYTKGDTSYLDQNFFYRLSNGTPVDLGVPFNTPSSQPCATPVVSFTTTPQTANPTCNAYLAYQRGGPVRTSIPTEQFSFQSRYFKNIDISGLFGYSSGISTVNNYQEFYQGFTSKSNLGISATSGPAAANRVSVTADAAATWYATEKFRIIDEFIFSDFRIPGQFSSIDNLLFTTSLLVAPVIYTPAACPPPFTAARCPPHNSSSAADVATAVSSRFLGQDIKSNTIQFQYDFNKQYGGRIGYLYRHRNIEQSDLEISGGTYYPGTAPGLTTPVNAARGACVNGPFDANGVCTAPTAAAFDTEKTLINENTLLLGLWARPTQKLRFRYDMELMYADKTFTRLSPRQYQLYKLRGSYTPTPWANIAGSVNIYEIRNNVTQINYLSHNRNYALTVTLNPSPKWSWDFGYTYNDVFSQDNICYSIGSATPPPGSVACALPGASPLEALSYYISKMNYGFTDITWQPVPRLHLTLGYAIDSTTGSTLILNPNSPSGPLDYNYNRPYGTVTFDVAKGVAFRGGWGFYDYYEKNETPVVTGIPSRSFRGNLVNLSMIYSF